MYKNLGTTVILNISSMIPIMLFELHLSLVV